MVDGKNFHARSCTPSVYETLKKTSLFGCCFFYIYFPLAFTLFFFPVLLFSDVVLAIDFFVTPKQKIIARAPKLSKVRKSRSAIRIVIKKVGNVGKMKQRREKKNAENKRPIRQDAWQPVFVCNANSWKPNQQQGKEIRAPFSLVRNWCQCVPFLLLLTR